MRLKPEDFDKAFKLEPLCRSLAHDFFEAVK